jgi:hypothetical protein
LVNLLQLRNGESSFGVFSFRWTTTQVLLRKPVTCFQLQQVEKNLELYLSLAFGNPALSPDQETPPAEGFV